MPWDNNTGGGRNSNGGPWGQAPGGGGGGAGGGGGGGPRRPGGNTPSLEEILSRGRDRFQGGVPGGRWAFLGGALVLVGLWLFNAVYVVNPQEVGVEFRLGQPKPEVSGEGLHFLLWPVETMERVPITLNQTAIGTAAATAGRTGRAGGEGFMLSADANIVDVRFAVQWTIIDPIAYLINVRDPDDMVRSASESAMRQIVGNRPADDIFRNDREGVAADVRRVTQQTLDQYGIGVSVGNILIENAAPPAEVQDAFNEVQRAEQDEDRLQEEARQYSNTLLGNARGEAAQIREEAAAYKDQVVQAAEGEAQRFLSIYAEYAVAPDVTRKRMYLETMESVLAQSNKVIVESGANGSGVIPYLPLPELRNNVTPTNTEAGR